MFKRAAACAILGCALASGCSGAAAPPQPGGPSSSRLPSASPSSLVFAGSTATAQQEVTVTEAGYDGIFSVSQDPCRTASIATVSPTSATGPSAQFEVIPSLTLGGTCSVTFVDASGQAVTVKVVVTVTQAIVSSEKRAQ